MDEVPSKGQVQPLHAASDGRESRQIRKREARLARQVSKPETQRSSLPFKRIEQRLSIIPSNKSYAGAPEVILPALPKSGGAGDAGMFIGFAVGVLLPMLVASIYFYFIASNQYMAEFKFTVKDASSSTTTTSSTGAATTSLSSLVGGSTIGPNYDNYFVAEFLTSRAAIEELQKRINPESLYSRPQVDWWARFNSKRPMEDFVRYWRGMVTAEYDPVTGIASAQVRAFTAQDALLIASSLLELSEDLVNRMSDRARMDAVRYAEKEVERAETRLKKNRAQLNEYRSRVGVIDPSGSVVASNSTLVQTLQGNIAQLETQLATLTRQRVQENSPLIVTLQNQIRSTKEQLRNIEATVGHNRDGQALSVIIGEYEQLDLERQFAQAMVTSTMQTLELARATAASQHMYVATIVRPSLPQSSTYPHRLTSVLQVGGIAFGLWLIALLITRSVRERFV